MLYPAPRYDCDIRRFCRAVTSFPCEPRVRLRVKGIQAVVGEVEVDTKPGFGVHVIPFGHPGTVEVAVVVAEGAKSKANAGGDIEPPPDDEPE